MVLHEETTYDRTHVARGHLRQAPEFHQAQTFLFLQDVQRGGRKIRRDDDLAEDAGNGAGQRLGHRPVGNDDATKRRLTIGRQGLVPSGEKIPAAPHPARVGVFEDGHRRLAEFRDEIHGGRDIEDVVVGKFLAVQLLEMVGKPAVKFGLLVRVFTVAEARRERDRAGEGRTEGRWATQIIGNGPVVARGKVEHFGREARPQAGRRRPAAGLHLAQDFRIVARIAHHRDRRVILRRAAQHRRPADVDVLDRLFARHTAAGHGLFKGVEVDHHQIDRRDAMRRRLCLVGRKITAEEQPAMDHGVQRFDPAVEHFRKTGMLGHILHL